MTRSANRAPISSTVDVPQRTTSRSPGRDSASTARAVARPMLEVSLAARLAEDASARPGAARPWTPAKTGKIAPRLMATGRTVMGRRRDVAIMRRGSDASTTRNDSPSAAGVGHVLCARRHWEARPPRRHPSRCRSSPAQRIASRGRDGARRWAIRWAKPCRIGPYRAERRAPASSTILPGFAGISLRGRLTNAMLHTREVAGSKPAAPITRKPRYGAVSAFPGRLVVLALAGPWKRYGNNSPAVGRRRRSTATGPGGA
jgi:hypothetical protein